MTASSSTMANKKLRIGIAGLGKMGKRHAVNFHELTQRASVIAVTTPDKTEHAWAQSNLEGIKLYEDYDDMLAKEHLDAVIVASATSVHAEQAIKAIEKGYHVMCEKPLSLDLNIVRTASKPYTFKGFANMVYAGTDCSRCVREVTHQIPQSKGDVCFLAPARRVLPRSSCPGIERTTWSSRGLSLTDRRSPGYDRKLCPVCEDKRRHLLGLFHPRYRSDAMVHGREPEAEEHPSHWSDCHPSGAERDERS